MIASLFAKATGTFLAVILILRIPSFPILSSSSSSQHHHETTTATAADSSSSFINNHHVNHKGQDDDKVSTTTLTYGEAIAASSAFDRELYHSLLYEPYRSQYTCQPRGIHLSQFHDVVHNNNNNNKKESHDENAVPDDYENTRSDKNDDYRVSVTVSFLLTSQSQDAAACGSAMAAVVYGRDENPEKPEGVQLSQTPPIQFNYTSLLSDGLYTSDWIHHITISNLQAGMERYWYRIIVLAAADENEKTSSSVATLQSAAAATSRRRLGHSSFRTRGIKAADVQSDLLLLNIVGKGEHQIVGKTEEHHFWTPPIPGSSTTLALVGDLGQTINSTKTMAHILQASLDPRGQGTAISSLLIAGDLSYADTDPHRWTSWFHIMEPLLRTTLLSTAAGNHEIEADIRNGREFVPYERYFRNPNRIQASLATSGDFSFVAADTAASPPASPIQDDYNFGNSFYSYQHGLARIIVLNAYSDTTVGSLQYNWLVNELQRHAQTRQQSSKKNTQPWLIVSFHSPFYTTFLGHVHENQARRMKTAMEPLFVQYGVNLVISGHDHGYMRTHSIRPASSTSSTTTTNDTANADVDASDNDSMDNAEIDPTGLSPIYLTLGAAGNREHHAPGYRNPDAQEEWVVARDLCDYGYGHLHLKNATHARLRWIRDHVVPDSMTISDDVWIVNRHHH